MIIEVNDVDATTAFGEKLGASLRGGEVIELVGDVGAGKTTLVKGIAKGLGINEDVQSPTFTISRQYDGRGGLTLAHYDFYRIDDAGIMADEIHEVAGDPHTVTVVEWSKVVGKVLPKNRIKISLVAPTINARKLILEGTELIGDEL